MAKVLIKRSSVPGKMPGVADLDYGELAINTADGKLYFKKDVAGQPVVVDLSTAVDLSKASYGSSSSSSSTVATTTVVAQTSMANALIFG